VWLWDLGAAEPAPRTLPHPAAVPAVVFHPAGTMLFTACADGRVRTWDPRRAAALGQPLVHPTGVVGLDITPDGRTLLAVTADGKARLWDRLGNRRVGVLPGSGRACLGPAGVRVVLAADNEVRIHTLARPLSRPPGNTGADFPRSVLPPPDAGQAIAYLDSGRQVLTIESVSGRARGLARLRDTRTGQPVGLPWLHVASAVDRLAVAPTGKMLATACFKEGKGSTVQVWEPAGKPLGRFTRARRVLSLAFDAVGRRLAVGDSGGVTLHEVPSGGQLERLPSTEGPILSLAFTPDGRRLVAGTAGAVRSWEIDGGAAGPVLEHRGPASSLAFDRAGRFLLVGGPFARLSDFSRRQMSSRLVGPVSAVRVVDGLAALIATRNGAVRRFDLARGEIIPPTIIAPVEVLGGDLSADGRRLLLGCGDGTARLWDLAGTGRALGLPVVHGSPVRGVFLAPGGKWFLTTGSDGTTRRWPVPRPWPDRATDDLARQVEGLTGQMVDGTGEMILLPAALWEKRRFGLPPLLPVEAWHDARASDAEADGDLFAARWHLDALLKRPGDPLLYARRMVIHARAGDFTGAAADLDRAAGRDPAQRSAALRNALADCQARQAWRAALWCLDLLLDDLPGDADLVAEGMFACRRLGEEGGRAPP
jgi:WD40 repeat protein